MHASGQPLTAGWLALLVAPIAMAAEKPFAAPQAVDPATSSGAGDLAQVTLSLVLVLAAVFAAAWLMRRLRGFGRPGAGAIEIVADVALGAKERAVLVQVGKQQVLLGVTPNQVNTLHVLTENVTVEGGNDQGIGGSQSALRARRAGADFKSILKRSFASGEGSVRPEFKAILKRSFGL